MDCRRSRQIGNQREPRVVLRSQAGAAVGYRLVNSNNAQVIFGGGLTGNNEQGVDTAATQNLEGVINFKMEYDKDSHPKTNFDLSVEYYPSLSNWGRQRLQINSDVRRELWRDFYVSLSGYDTFDSPRQVDLRPTTTSASSFRSAGRTGGRANKVRLKPDTTGVSTVFR